jgi:hypothetical protein
MSNVVYLIAGLPSLTYGRPATVSLAEFTDVAREQLSESEYNQLELLDIRDLGKATQISGLKSVGELFGELQTDKFEIRKARQQERTPNVLNIPRKVLDQNPLEIEKHFMKALWDELDSIGSLQSFTLTEVFVYKLKLQILERMNTFNKEKGLGILEAVVNPSNESMEQE